MPLPLASCSSPLLTRMITLTQSWSSVLQMNEVVGTCCEDLLTHGLRQWVSNKSKLSVCVTCVRSCARDFLRCMGFVRYPCPAAPPRPAALEKWISSHTAPVHISPSVQLNTALSTTSSDVRDSSANLHQGSDSQKAHCTLNTVCCCLLSS